jgi:small conductance mechanosensitive channel
MGIDLSNAWKSGSRIINTVVSLLPNAILAIVVFVIFLIAASAAKSVVRRFSQRRQRRQSLGLLLGQLAQVTVVVLGFLIALSIVAPSFQAADLIKILGVGSVAIGFAFQNILQNFLAGILILIHEPYKLGDFITINGIEGLVEDIQTRATVIATADGHRAVIPNAVLFTNPVVVRNADYKKDLEPNELAPFPVPQKSGR